MSVKTLIVTGATSGIGKELTKTFIKNKWQVIGLGRNKATLEYLKNKYCNNLSIYSCDIRKKEEVVRTFKDIFEKHKKIDILVNNAATFKRSNFKDCDFNDIDSIIDTNLKGTMYCTLEIVKHMLKKEVNGRIINIASVASTHGIKKQSVYCASKYGLNGFSESLNQELIDHNISISTIFPGGVDTPLWNSKNEYPGGDIANILKPKDIANLVDYISKLENRIILKNLTIFPSNEWH